MWLTDEFFFDKRRAIGCYFNHKDVESVTEVDDCEFLRTRTLLSEEATVPVPADFSH